MKSTFTLALWCLFVTPLSLFSQQPVLVADLTVGSTGTFDEDEEKIMAAIGATAIFRIKGPDGAWQTWASDGSAAGTLLLQEFSGNAVFGEQVHVADGLAFVVTQGQTEIWFTDGSPGGTAMLASLPSTVQNLAVLNGALFLETLQGYSDSRLLQYNFQDDALETIYTFPSYWGILDMEVLNDSTLILLAGSEEGRALFTSDGTAAGTQPYYLLNDGSEFSQATLMTKAGDKVYFFYKFPGSDGGYFLYATDGTADGTRQLQEFDINYNSGDFEEERSVYAWQDKFFFNGWPLGESSNRHRLFVSDGTPEGTFALDPDPNEYLRPAWMTAYNSHLYFKGDFCCFTFGVFRTDGTVAGTEEVLTGSGVSTFGGDGLTVFGGHLYFSAYQNETGEELWVSDGTVAGTSVLELVPGEGDALPEGLLAAESLLFFTAETPSTGRELFVLGRAPGCVPVTSKVSATICEGEAFELGGNVYTTAGAYEVFFFTPEGCDSTVLLSLQEAPLPEVSLGPDVVITQNETLTFDISGGYASQEWSDGSTGTSFEFVASEYGLGTFTVSVRVVGENGCEYTDEIQITVVMGSATESPAGGPSAIYIMPNPVRAGHPVQLGVSGPAPADGRLRLQVYKMDVDLVLEDTLAPQGTAPITWAPDVPLLPGVYVIRLSQKGRTVAAEKLVVF